MLRKLIEGIPPLPISNILEDPIIDTYYEQDGELLAGSGPISDCNRKKKDSFDADKNNDRGVSDDKIADDGTADDGATNYGAVDDNNDQEEGNH